MGIDAIVTWPKHCDYPLWREQLLRTTRYDLDRVIVAFTEHNTGDDLSGWVADELHKLGVETFYASAPGVQDWRDVAVRESLSRSDADWVWFTEQDFRIEGCGYDFWRGIQREMHNGASVVGVRDSGPHRWHPCCLFVRRSVVEQTSCYYGPVPVDHFWQFSSDLDRLPVLRVELPEQGWSHMQGLSQNHHLVHEGKYDEVFKSDEFAAYLRRCLQLDVPRHALWDRDAEQFLEYHERRG